MKRSTVMTVLTVAILVIYSCSKDREMKSNVSTSTLAGNFTHEVYTRFGEMPNEQRSRFFNRSREKLTALQNHKYKGAESDEPLDDAFFALEGLLNGMFYNEMARQPEWVVTSGSVQLRITENNGSYYVSNQEYLQAWAELYNSVTDRLNQHQDEVFVMADMVVQQVNTEEGFAEIHMELYTAPEQAGGAYPYMTPAVPYHGAEKAG
tara:strand:- start:1734 stop:2354 length:621 start_codon:yes stop_codon:yes gene_type:complete